MDVATSQRSTFNQIVGARVFPILLVALGWQLGFLRSWEALGVAAAVVAGLAILAWMQVVPGPMAVWFSLLSLVFAGPQEQLPFIVPTGIVVVPLLAWSPFRRLLGGLVSSPRFRPGSVSSARTISVVLFVAAASVGGYRIWSATTGRRTAVDVPGPDWPVLIALLVGFFAMFNAITEELLWRLAPLVVLRTGADRIQLPLLVVAQAISFGLAHYRGFPNGLSGVVLAASFGFAQMAVLLYTRRFWSVVLVHALVDVGIAATSLTFI